jgi:hypothetical protein
MAHRSSPTGKATGTRLSRWCRSGCSSRLTWSPNPRTGAAALFLLGARQTGKTTYLRRTFPQAHYYDLLDTALSAELSIRPHRLREEVLADAPQLVVIDEVQHVPPLMPEVHWLLENAATRFVLCGSSARRLRHRSRNLLGGRATEFHMHPLTSREIGDVDLVVGFMDLVIECKSVRELRAADLKGLRALREEHTPRRTLVVSRAERHRRTEDGIEVVPWQQFCRELWAGDLI